MATAAGASVLPSNGSGQAKRKSYAREFKLTVVNHYRDHNIFVPDVQLFNAKTILYAWGLRMMLS